MKIVSDWIPYKEKNYWLDAHFRRVGNKMEIRISDSEVVEIGRKPVFDDSLFTKKYVFDQKSLPYGYFPKNKDQLSNSNMKFVTFKYLGKLYQTREFRFTVDIVGWNNKVN